MLWSNKTLRSQPLLLGIISLGALTLFGCAWRLFQQNRAALAETADSPAKMRADGVFNMVNTGQWILISIVGNVLVNLVGCFGAGVVIWASALYGLSVKPSIR